MSYKSVSKYLLLVVFFILCLMIPVSAWALDLEDSDSVNVTAFVGMTPVQMGAIQNNSILEVDPNILYVGQQAEVTITLLEVGDIPVVGHSVRIAIDGDDSNVVLTQPTALTDSNGVTTAYVSATDAGSFKVIGYDSTFAGNGQEILIDDWDTVVFQFLPPPFMQAEPEFTFGLTNTVYWDEVVDSDAYFVQISESLDFSSVLSESGWISTESYTFENLIDETTYYYRVKARTTVNAITEWSNIVYSTQDDEDPISTPTSTTTTTTTSTTVVGSVSTSTTTLDSSSSKGDEISIDIYWEDNLNKLKKINVYAKTEDGAWTFLGSTIGSRFTIAKKVLLNLIDGDLFGEVCFYTQAEDMAGNLESLPNEKTKSSYCRYIEFTRVEYYSVIANRLFDSVLEFFGNNKYLIVWSSWLISGLGLVVAWIVSDINLGEFGQYLFYGLLELLRKVKLVPIRKEELIKGRVFDSKTKEHIPFALVKLVVDGQVVEIDIANKRGEYGFNQRPEKFKIFSEKAGYRFPEKFENLLKWKLIENNYFGEEIEVPEDLEDSMELNLPMEKNKAGAWSLLINEFRNEILIIIIGLLGINLLALGGLVIAGQSDFVIYTIISNVLVLLLLNYELSFFIDSFGRAFSVKGRKLDGVHIGIYDISNGDLIDERITDERGEYSFWLDRGLYYLRPIMDNYQFEDSNFDRGYPVGSSTRRNAKKLIAEDLRLKPSSSSKI